MYISLEQILVGGCAVAALQSVLMLVTWLQDRSATWLLWMCVLFVDGGLSLALYLPGGVLPLSISIALGTGTFIVAFFIIWTAMRRFEGRDVQWPVLATALGGWAVVCLVPQMLDNYLAAALALSGLGGAGVGASAFELWRGRKRSPLLTRWVLAGFLGVVAATFGFRVPFLHLMPFPFGALQMQTSWTAFFVLSLVGAAVILSVLSIMLAKEQAAAELRAFALTDPLTGLPNRRAFAVDVAHVARGHAGKDAAYCLVMFDLDHFKSINDTYGHALGDNVLKVFAEVARSNLPDRNAFYRLGGEEFCAILPETDEAAARMIADALRVSFRSTSLIHSGRSVEVTVSGGIGCSASTGLDPAKVQMQADGALYRAKSLGRDCVCVGSEQRIPDFDIGWAAA